MEGLSESLWKQMLHVNETETCKGCGRSDQWGCGRSVIGIIPCGCYVPKGCVSVEDERRIRGWQRDRAGGPCVTA